MKAPEGWLDGEVVLRRKIAVATSEHLPCTAVIEKTRRLSSELDWLAVGGPICMRRVTADYSATSESASQLVNGHVCCAYIMAFTYQQDGPPYRLTNKKRQRVRDWSLMDASRAPFAPLMSPMQRVHGNRRMYVQCMM